MTSAAQDQNVDMVAGERKVILVELTTVDDQAADLDPKGTAIYGMAVYKTGEVKLRKTLASGLRLVLPQHLEITIEPEDTAGLSGRFVQDAIVRDALGNPSHTFRGTMTIAPAFL